jgi:hypothetical protein
MDAVRNLPCCPHIFSYEDNYGHCPSTSNIGMTGDGITGGGSNSSCGSGGSGGGGPCRGHPEIINLLKLSGFVYQQF